MKKEKTTLRNTKNEKLEVLMTSPSQKPKGTILFVHGFGSNMHENFSLFDEIVKSLDEYRCIQFSFSGYGGSEGLQEEVSLEKMRRDLYVMLGYAQSFDSEISVIAHSLGALLAVNSVDGDLCKRLILTSPSQIDPKETARGIQKRILSAKGELNTKGVSVYPRTSGEVQRLGSDFWKDFENWTFKDRLITLKKELRYLKVFIPSQDEVVKQEGLDF